jgi:hypothetical protein
MKDNTNIIDKIKLRHAQKKQQKWNKQMVLDAKKLVTGKEILVHYFTPNLEIEERHLKDHNFYMGFHNHIFQTLEPHQKIALLMKLDAQLVKENLDVFTPSSVGEFVVGQFDDSYFAKRENGVNTYYIGLEMLEQKEVDSYTMLYMLFSLHMQAKAYEELEQKTADNPILEDLKLNLANPIKRTQGYDKFIMQEPMTKQEELKAVAFLCQPIEQYAKLNTQKVETLAASINHFGIGKKDEVYEMFLEDRAYFDQKEQELIEKTYGKNTSPITLYKNMLELKQIER